MEGETLSLAKTYAKRALLFFLVFAVLFGCTMIIGRLDIEVKVLEVAGIIFTISALLAALICFVAGGIFFVALPLALVGESRLWKKLFPTRIYTEKSYNIAGATIFSILFTGAALIIPSVLNFSGQAKQSEAKQNLVDLYKAQQKYHAAHGQYATTFEELDWNPRKYEKYIRYSYFIPKTGGIKADQGIGYSDIEEFRLPFKASPFSSKNAFKVYAIANIDIDPVWDVWSIDDGDNLVNEVDDVFTDSWEDWKKKH
jgi:type II secretory pathway pseudopilin PulG